jgi:hypothetical protein
MLARARLALADGVAATGQRTYQGQSGTSGGAL